MHTGEGEPDVRGRIRVGDREFLRGGLSRRGGRDPLDAGRRGMLFVVTVDGQLYCFGPARPRRASAHEPAAAGAAGRSVGGSSSRSLLQATGDVTVTRWSWARAAAG